VSRKPKLFTYIIPIDDGAAPNPFGGLCTLAICKPGIRRAAQVGDWVAGFGSKNAPSGDLRGRLVYAMRVEETITLREYDRRANREFRSRIPNLDSADLWERLGDCIYEFGSGGGRPRQRPGVTGPGSVQTDLSGKQVLVSKEFYYFGRKPVVITRSLQEICQLQRGFRSHKNDDFVERFIQWVKNLDFAPGVMHAWPGYDINWKKRELTCGKRANDGVHDSHCKP
jgi:hypothetical protein